MKNTLLNHIAASATVLAGMLALAGWGRYEVEKCSLTDASGRIAAVRASSIMVLDVAAGCRSERDLSRRLGNPPIRIAQLPAGDSLLGYCCADGKLVVVRVRAGSGGVIGCPEIANLIGRPRGGQVTALGF